MTLGQCFELFQQRGEVIRRPSTNRNNTNQFNKHFKQWADRRLDTLSRREIVELHSAIGAKHKYAANRAVALVRALYSFAIDQLGVKLDNPARRIKKFTEHSRERFLQAHELPRFFKAVQDYPSPDLRDFFLLLLFTGVRSGNLKSARWIDFDLIRSVWTIPSTDHKTKQSQMVPLVGPAVEILQRRFHERISDEWVFPSRGKTGHLVEPYRAWLEITAAAKLEGLRMHDLRRSLGSWQAGLGTPLTIIGKSLGHRQAQTTLVYARLDLDPVRESVERATTAMLQAGGQQ
jgi:integrase